MTEMTKYAAEHLLGLTGSYNKLDLNQAFREKVRKYHPDLAAAHGEDPIVAGELMTQINEAKSYLEPMFEHNETITCSSTPNTSNVSSTAQHTTNSASTNQGHSQDVPDSEMGYNPDGSWNMNPPWRYETGEEWENYDPEPENYGKDGPYGGWGMNHPWGKAYFQGCQKEAVFNARQRQHAEAVRERDRKLAEERALRQRLAAQENKAHMTLDDLFSRIEDGKQTDLNLIVKADVQGSIEALRDAFEKMDQSEVRINIVHSAVGGITETDVTLASASDAIIIGFNVRHTGKSKQQAEKEKVDIRLYRVIYQAIEEINAARVGLLSPDIVEEDTGIAEVRELFKVPKVGTIAGCYMIEGEMNRDDHVRIVRNGTVIYDGTLASMRRFKDDVKSVRSGYECGLGVEGFQDLKVGDTIEGYVIKEVERTE